MSSEEERGTVIGVHQELVSKVEGSARRMRVLAGATIVVSAYLALSYVSQLLLLVTGTTTVTVDLTDPALVGAELAVLGLVLVWLYVGVTDFLFFGKMRKEIRAARAKETEIEGKIAG